jgi:multiple sugar transport system substrate-binding protein
MDGDTALPINQQNPSAPPSGESSAQVNSSIQSPPTGPVPFTPPPSMPPSSADSSRRNLLKKILIGVVILVVIITGILVFALSKGTAPKPVKIVWWGLWEDNKTVEPIIDDFHRAHPNITVEYIKEDPTQYRERLVTRIKNGTGPDIFRFHNTWYPMLSDVLLPLPSDVITPDAFKNEYYPVMQKDLMQNGALYGIPLDADSLVLFVNTDLLHSLNVDVPSTWDDFVKASNKLTVKDQEGKIKTAGAALGLVRNVTHAEDIISLLLVQQGVNLQNPSSSLQQETDAISFYTSFVKGEQPIWDDSLDNSLDSFAQGNLAMYFGYSWDMLRMQELNKNLAFKVYPVPNLYGRNTTIASYWVEGVSSQSPNRAAALLFMNYLTQKETLQKFYAEAAKERGFGEPYPRVDMADSLKDNQIAYPFISQLKNASSTYFSSGTYDGETGLNSQANQYLDDTINSIVNSGNSPQSAVQTLNQGIAQLFQQYGIH